MAEQICFLLTQIIARKCILELMLTEMPLKNLEMSLCALVEVECIMALYSKGRQTVLLSTTPSTNGNPAEEKSESKAKTLTQTFLNPLGTRHSYEPARC